MGEYEFSAFQAEQVKNVKKKKSGFATAGMVLGIIGICTSFIPIVNNASFFLGILAVIFGVIPLIKKASVGKAVTALVLGVLSIVITLCMQAAFAQAVDDAFDDVENELGYMAGDKTDDILRDNLEINIGSFKVTEDEYFDSTELVVKLKNKGDEKKSFTVQIEAVDKDGNRIDTDYIYANDLIAGQGQEFKIFEYVTSDKIDAFKTATFRVVEVSMY